MSIFRLPDIGEGVQEGEIVKWNVKEGDFVKKDDIIVEIMTYKVTVQIPSPINRQVLEIFHREGEITKVWEPFIDIGGDEPKNGEAKISEIEKKDYDPRERL